MTIETLMYIYKLLKDEDYKTNEVYKAARNYQNELEEGEGSRPEIKKATERADECMEKHFAASRALREFEQKEWN